MNTTATATETAARVAEILTDVTYADWRFEVLPTDGNAALMQPVFRTADTETGDVTVLSGRKWWISQHATPSEIVQTAFLAVLVAIEHEARENFRFQGVPIYGPHFSAGALAKFARDGRHHDARPPKA